MGLLQIFRHRAWIGLALLAVVMAGCARGRLAHEPGLVTGWDRTPFPAMLDAPELSVVLHARHLAFGEPSSSPIDKWWTTRKVRNQLRDVFGEFPFLAEARWNKSEAPSAALYRLEIEATNAIRGSKFRSSLSGATKYIFPATETGVIELEAWMYRDDALLKKYEASGTFKVSRHLLYLLVPWKWGRKVPSNTIEDTFRDLFLQIQRDARTLQMGV